MGRKKHKSGSKKDKSKKNREKKTVASLSKEQSKQKSSFEDISEIFLGSNPEQEDKSNNTNSTDNISGKSETDGTESKSEDTSTNEMTSTDTNQCCEEIKAKQQELLNNLKNISDAIASITLTRDNVDSLRIELLSNIYFNRQVRPLIDAANLMAFASSNMTSVAQNISNNTFGEKKEVKTAFKLSYKMNDEIDDVLDALSRRIKLYVAQLDEMDKNCPPFDSGKDS